MSCKKFYSTLLKLSKDASINEKKEALNKINNHITADDCGDCAFLKNKFHFLFDSNSPFCESEQMIDYVSLLSSDMINGNEKDYELEHLHLLNCEGCQNSILDNLIENGLIHINDEILVYYVENDVIEQLIDSHPKYENKKRKKGCRDIEEIGNTEKKLFPGKKKKWFNNIDGYAYGTIIKVTDKNSIPGEKKKWFSHNTDFEINVDNYIEVIQKTDLPNEEKKRLANLKDPFECIEYLNHYFKNKQKHNH